MLKCVARWHKFFYHVIVSVMSMSLEMTRSASYIDLFRTDGAFRQHTVRGTPYVYCLMQCRFTRWVVLFVWHAWHADSPKHLITEYVASGSRGVTALGPGQRARMKQIVHELTLDCVTDWHCQWVPEVDSQLCSRHGWLITFTYNF